MKLLSIISRRKTVKGRSFPLRLNRLGGQILSDSETFDIVVVGAGVIGVATAYYLQKNNPDKRILILDRLPAAGQANTAMSAAAVRNMFASSTNQLLTHTSIKCIEHIQNEIGYELLFEKTGYLWLLSDDQFNHESVQTWMKRMETSGIHYKVFNKEELKNMIPGLNVDFTNDEEAELMNLEEVSYGLFGGDCGVLDPTRLVEFYLEEFKKISDVKPRFGVDVEELLLSADPPLELPGEPYVWQNKLVTGVKTNKGVIHAETVVIATGAWANELLDPIGMNSQTKAKKRQMFVLHADEKEGLHKLLDSKGFNELNCIPFTILPSAGVYFRPQLQERGFWIGCGDKLGRAYHYKHTPSFDVAESSYYENSVYPVLSKYIPAFEGSRPVNSWGGGYNYSPDAIPFVYYENGVLVVNGASGSGIMKADAMARIADALYRGEEEAELFGGKKISSSALTIKDRDVEIESVVI
ncbi:MAG: FAD-dependent oxidoreductase [Candidatus Lokiarchaeota archaeon]|nr:FAD-dependent oxidoreductase [Candidatus Lokiarchaeota archaeon]